jgi:hypothetical protein
MQPQRGSGGSANEDEMGRFHIDDSGYTGFGLPNAA